MFIWFLPLLIWWIPSPVTVDFDDSGFPYSVIEFTVLSTFIVYGPVFVLSNDGVISDILVVRDDK